MAYAIEYGQTCTICLDGPKVGQFELTDPCSNKPKIVTRGKILSCNHAFHEACINEYLFKNTDCPLCRRHTSSDERTFSWIKTANDPSRNYESHISCEQTPSGTSSNTLIVEKNFDPQSKEAMIAIAAKLIRGETVSGIILKEQNSFSININ